MSNPTIVRSIRIAADTWSRIEAAALVRGVSPNAFVTSVLGEWLSGKAETLAVSRLPDFDCVVRVRRGRLSSYVTHGALYAEAPAVTFETNKGSTDV
jgi:hypothetical protein